MPSKNVATPFLSKKSLEIIFEFTESNPDHPLAELYLDSCMAIRSGMDSLPIYEQMMADYGLPEPVTWMDKEKSRVWQAAKQVINLPYVCRDEIGRVILKLLKHQKKKPVKLPIE